MKTKKHRAKNEGVALHDGKAWRLYVKSAGLAQRAAVVKGGAASLPDEILEAAERGGVGRLRFLVSGELHRIDGLSLDGLSPRRAAESIATAAEEAAGPE